MSQNDYVGQAPLLLWALVFFLGLCKQTQVYISGGGIKNKFITMNLNKLLLNYNVLSIADIGIDPLFKESFAFALLAASNYFDLKIDTKDITGAEKPYIIGEISKWR